MAFKLSIQAFDAGEPIPKRHTGEGEDVSPAMEWSGEPEATKSFVLIVDDPDAPAGTWNHWLFYDIPASMKSLGEAHSPGQTGLEGITDFGRPGYGGPYPPKGHGRHHYHFKIFAMDVASLGLGPGAKRADLDRAMRGHVLGQASHMGTYERK